MNPTVKAVACVLALMGCWCLSAAPAMAGVSDKLLPDETEMVVGVNVRSMLDSEVIKKNVLEDLKKQIKEGPASELLGRFGLDPLKDIDSVIIAIGAIKVDAEAGRPRGEANNLMLLKGRYDHEKIKSALEELQKETPDAVKTSEHAKVVIYETKQGERPFFAAFLDKGLLAASDSKDYIVEAIDKHQGTKKTQLKSKDVAAAITRADEKQTIWMAMSMPEAVKELMKNAPQGAELSDKLEAMTLAVTMKDNILIQYDMHCTDKSGVDEVKKVVETTKANLENFAGLFEGIGPTLKEILTEVRISSKDKVVTIRLEMNPELAEKFFKMLRDAQPRP